MDVIIPLKFRDSVTYSVPESLEGSIVPGSIVKVTVVGRSYTAVVLRVKDVPGFDPSKIIPLRGRFLLYVLARRSVQVCGSVYGQGT